MKRFIAAAALVLGIFVAQVSQAEAYEPKEYDVVYHMIYRCRNCNGQAETLFRNFEEPPLIETRTAAGCPGGGEHYWVYAVFIAYQYRSGEWVEFNRTYY